MPIEYLPSAFARVALDNVERAYPRRLDQLLAGPDVEWRPGVLHPAFYGSYDWHSAVHMHWLLARLLFMHPDIPERGRDRGAARPPPQRLEHRAGAGVFQWSGWRHFRAAVRVGLAPGAAGRADPAGTLAPRASPPCDRAGRAVRTASGASPYPVRAGTHGNTAFACILALDYASNRGRDPPRRRLSESGARAGISPTRLSGGLRAFRDDFLSPALVEALLMKRILPDGGVGEWLNGFLPSDLGPLSRPPTVLDHADAKQSHLDGLCLSRAWCFTRFWVSRGSPRSTWRRGCRM